MRVDIVQYNILSSSLATVDQYPECNPEDLDSANRLPKIINELSAFAKAGCIICIEELTQKWLKSLFTMFTQLKYSLVHLGYSGEYQGYMGVAIAFPISKYELLETEFVRIGEKLPDNKIKFEMIEQEGSAEKIPNNVWSYARARPNYTIMLKFEQFVVAVYHVPAAFWSPVLIPAITMHSIQLCKEVHRFADGLPYVIAGDFNTPDYDQLYQSIVTGRPITEGPYSIPNDMEWDSSFVPLKDAYRGTGSESTNHVITKKGEKFSEVIDYIFFSQHGIRAMCVVKTPRISDDVSLPNADHPSDHLPIAAFLKIDASS